MQNFLLFRIIASIPYNCNMINAVREKGGVSENTESLFCVLHRKSIFLFTCLIDIQGTDIKNNCNYILLNTYLFNVNS